MPRPHPAATPLLRVLAMLAGLAALLLWWLSFALYDPPYGAEVEMAPTTMSSGTLTYRPVSRGIVGVRLVTGNEKLVFSRASAVDIRLQQTGLDLRYEAKPIPSTLTESMLIGTFVTESLDPVAVAWSLSVLSPVRKGVRIEVMSFLESDREAWGRLLAAVFRIAAAILGCAALVATYAAVVRGRKAGGGGNR